MTPVEIDRWKALNRMCRAVTGWDVPEILREFPRNEEAVALLGEVGPHLANEDRTRN